MKKSYVYLIVFYTLIAFILFLNSFILNILNGYYMLLFLFLITILFKYKLGTEKGKEYNTKSVFSEMIICLLIFFILYYLFGLITGFRRTSNYGLYSLINVIIPLTLTTILKEYLRYGMLKKSENSKILIILTLLTFVFLDITNSIYYTNFNSSYNTFTFIALTFLPNVLNNILCNYISLKSNYKISVFYMLVINLYVFLLPIVPNINDYLFSIIFLILPIAILYKIKNHLNKEEDSFKEVLKKVILFDFTLLVPITMILLFIYLNSGYFRYQSLVIASGSMMPNIKIGDMVIVDKKTNINEYKVGDVLAHKYEDRIIVHRIVEIKKEKQEYYFYTKGDANNAYDKYPITSDMIVGVVKNKIPYIGLPTVWVNNA